MFLWFAVVAAVLVAEIFQSPMVDYRIVALGAVLPLSDLVLSSAGLGTVFHSLLAPIVILAVVMATTVGRRLLRRRLLGIPIGMFLHLVLDGTWADQSLFWWPLFGLELSDIPERSGLVFRLGLEVVAVGVAVVAYRRYGLDDVQNRERLIRQGHLQRGYLSAG